MFHRFAVPAEPSTATWTGPWVEPGFEIHEVIPSWNAETPPGSLVELGLQARTQAWNETGWYTLGRWTFPDEAFKRTSVPGQDDAFGSVATDTFRAAGAPSSPIASGSRPPSAGANRRSCACSARSPRAPCRLRVT